MSHFGLLSRQACDIPVGSQSSLSRPPNKAGIADLAALPPIADARLQLVYRLQFLAPSCANNGQRFPASYYRELEANVERVVGALSRREGSVRGSWCCGSRTYDDRSREYFVDVADSDVARDLAVALYQFIARRFDQLAVSIDITARLSTAFASREGIMTLPTRFAWQLAAPRPRLLLLPVLICVLLFFIRCDEVSGPLGEKPSRVLERAAGISEPLCDPQVVDLVVDSTEGSAGTSQNLSAQLAAILPVLARRSGVLRLWLLRDVESTVVVATVPFARPQSTNTHVQDRERTASVAAA